MKLKERREIEIFKIGNYNVNEQDNILRFHIIARIYGIQAFTFIAYLIHAIRLLLFFLDSAIAMRTTFYYKLHMT